MRAATIMVAAVQDSSDDLIQGIFNDLVERWSPSRRIVGVLADDHGLEGRACNAGWLRNIADGRRYSIFQDLGPGSEGCHLDARGVTEAGEAVRRDISADCDLVVLSKFGKLEAAGEGLMPVLISAVDAGVPVLTSVSPPFRDAWAGFAGPMGIVLPADTDAITSWWETALKRSALSA